MILYGITLIVLSLVAAPSLLLDKKPNAKELLDKLVPYQGWAGIIFCIWGIWGIINAVLSLGWLSYGMSGVISWLTLLLYAVVEAGLGFILGYGLIVKYMLSSNEQAKQKGDQVLAKLLPWQKTLAIVGIILGIWCIICGIFFRMV